MQHFHRGSATRSTSPVRHEIGTRSYRPPANFHASTCPSDWYVNGRYSKCTATLWWQQRVARCRSSTATSWPSTPARTPSLFLYLSYALCYWLLRLYMYADSRVPSFRSLLVIEERMRSSGCFHHWLVIGKTSNLKTLHQLPPHGMYLCPSLHSSSFTIIPSAVWEGHGVVVLIKRLYEEGE